MTPNLVNKFTFTSQVGPANKFDVYASSKGECWGYPCPLAIKIYNRNFVSVEFNGYYIANHPMRRTLKII